MIKAADQRKGSPVSGAGAQLPDEELMLRYQGGEVWALEELISRHGRTLYGFLVRQLGNRAKAEDAYQEIFLRVIRAAGNYSPQARFSAWLYTIARNFCVDQSRRDYFRSAESLDEPEEENGRSRLSAVSAETPDPEAELRAKELNQSLEKAIAGLPAVQREVFLLRERAGLSFQEIAEMTQAPLNTVKTRMHYALSALRKALVQEGFLSEDET